MKTIIYLTLSFLFLAPACYADSPAMPRPYVKTSDGGQYLIKMLPEQYQKNLPTKSSVGIAYRLEKNGDLTELWRFKDNYSFEVYLSKEGQYLVVMGPWSVGQEPEEKDLAVSFYSNGILLKEYSTADLVEDKSAVSQSVSHYFWLARNKMDCDYNTDTSAEAELKIDWNNIFHLKTIDGISYEFDISTGEISKKILPDPATVEECEG